MRRLIRFPQVRASNTIRAAPQPQPTRHLQARAFHFSRSLRQERSDPAAHRNFYRTHGRALFKALTLAFFTYQVVFWAWTVLETEEEMGHKKREIKELESEVRLLDQARRESGDSGSMTATGTSRSGPRLLEQKIKK